jgi:60 kDa SS-A/Ro ribonucleoprotein
MSDPLMELARYKLWTPQNEPIPGRTDQVKNNAGGYVFSLDDWSRLHRFLILGVEGGTYYVGERQLTRDNADVVFRCIAAEGVRVVNHVVTLSESGDAPKQQPLLFTLAACSAAEDVDTRRAALAAVDRVCRTATMLFIFNSYCDGMRGWGRGRQRAMKDWYRRDVNTVAHQAVKYRQREGWTQRDMLRLAKPKPASREHDALFGWIAGKVHNVDELPAVVRAYIAVNQPNVTISEVVRAVDGNGLPWEALPDRFINEPAVWDALLSRLGATALLRQLPRLTRIGLIKPLATNALFGYKSGVGRSGSNWTPVPWVVDLLDDAFHASFGAIVPANKRTLVALDVSGSMTWEKLATMPALVAGDAAAAMSMATVRTEPDSLVTAFTSEFSVLPVTARNRLDEVINMTRVHHFGSTDCALPMMWAERNRVPVDTFVVYTDNETWHGRIHPTQALRNYRQAMGIDARLAVCGMTATAFSIADPQDPGQLDLVGFDAAVPHLLSEFSRGSL